MRILAKLKDSLRRRRAEAEARRLIAEAFADPALLAGTSLRRRHASRWVLLGHDRDERGIVRIRFGVLRHPRPYAFSRQSHKVIERYEYDVRGGSIRVLDGHNLTRARGDDADEPPY